MSISIKTQQIECSSQPLGISFHPSKNIVAASLTDGTVECEFMDNTISFIIHKC